MDDAGEQFPRHFVHIGDHQQEPLRRGVGSGQRAGLKGTVYGAGRAGFTLHFDNADFLSKDVLQPAGRPFVGVLRHIGGGGDGINPRDFGERVRYVRRSGVAVHSFSFHLQTSYFSLDW
jgi:hypothetical protein